MPSTPTTRHAAARLRARLVDLRDRAAAARHFDAGRVHGPAPITRRRHLRDLARERGARSFIESGTYRGDTVAFLAGEVARTWSIEIEPRLHAAAVSRFAGREDVTILHGDATEHVPRLLLHEASHPALVFLDGHWSGGITGRGDVVEPAVLILERLRGHALAPGTTVVVDDVRLFGAEDGFPTLEALLEAAEATFPGSSRTVELDALVIRA